MSGHGGRRIHRKTKGMELKIIHAEIAPEHYEWVSEVAAAKKISKAAALEGILARDKRGAQLRNAKACLQHESVVE